MEQNKLQINKKMNKFQKLQIFLGFTCLILASLDLSVESKPLESISSGDKHEDPILALPSQEQPLLTNEQPMHLQQPTEEPSAYISSPNYQIQYLPAPETPQPIVLNQEEQPSSGVRQEVYYVVKPENQVPEQSGEQHDENCEHRHEYVSVSGSNSPPAQEGSEDTRKQYPGEIIYVSQNGDASKYLGESQESNTRGESLVNNAEAVSDGVSATILTEVPAKDMPQEVLEKLKKDYGVKVVATREYPGANLVINCDDESSQTTAICAKSLAFTTTTNGSPYDYSAANQQPANIANEQQNLSNEQPNYIIDSSRSRAIQESRFGSRNSGSLNEQYESNLRAEHEAMSNGHGDSARTGKAEAQPDSDSGFEIQPAASEKLEPKQNANQYRGRS